jgi:sirohydrochlorin ferrochelatase
MKPGLLVISHGSREAGWVALVDDSVEAARVQLESSLPIEAAFLELVEGRLIQDGIDRLEEAGVTHLFALPLFVSSGSTHVDEIGWALGAYPKPRTETEL